MNRVMVIRPKHEGDISTTYTNAWLNDIIWHADSLGWDVLDLTDKTATREMVEAWITEFKPNLIIAAGHGFAKEFIGDDGEPIFTPENTQILSGKTVFLLSCNTGAYLGNTIAEKGGCYIGWSIPVEWTLSDKPNPQTDYKATPIKDATLMIAHTLLENQNIQAAYTEAIKVFNYYIDTYQKARIDNETTQLIKANKDGLTYNC